jgi:hypothetical protein
MNNNGKWMMDDGRWGIQLLVDWFMVIVFRLFKSLHNIAIL